MKFISSMTSFFKINYKTSYLLLVVLFVGIILRVYGLSEQCYWLDEIRTLNVVQGGLDSIISGGRPPIYLVFAHFWFESFGVSEVATRLLSIIFGVSSIVLIYIIGKSLFDQKVGVLSAFFMSVSKFQIYYSQELRYYSLYELLTLISFFFYIRLLNSKSYIYTVLYILSTILLYYTHDFAVLIIAAQNLYVLIKYKTLRSIIAKWFLSQFIILLGIAPRFIERFGDSAIGKGAPNWISSPSMWSPLNTIYNYMGFKINNSIVDDIAIIFLLIGTVIYFLIIGKEKWMKSLNQSIAVFKRSWNIKSETMIVVLWFFVPIALILIASEVLKPMYLDRYLICSAPACYILVALLLTKVKKVIPIGIILITYTILISPGLYHYYTKPVREDWREVGSYIKENDKRRNPMVLISYHSLPSFKWYNKGNYEYCRLRKRTDLAKLFNGQIDQYKDKKVCNLDDIDHFWLILNKKPIDKRVSSDYRIKDSLFRTVKEKEFFVRNNKITLYSFEKVKE